MSKHILELVFESGYIRITPWICKRDMMAILLSLDPVHIRKYTMNIIYGTARLDDLDLYKRSVYLMENYRPTEKIVNYNRKYILSGLAEKGYMDLITWVWNYYKEINVTLDIHHNDDYAFWVAMRHGHMECCQFLLDRAEEQNTTINFHSRNDSPFKDCLRNGHLSCAKWFNNLCNEIDVPLLWSCFKPSVFINICIEGTLECAQWFLQTATDRGMYINLNYNDDWAFRRTFAAGRLDTARWLLTLVTGKHGRYRININANHDEAFRLACHGGYYESVRWLWNYSIETYSPINLSWGCDGYGYKDNLHDAFDSVCRMSKLNNCNTKPGHIKLVRWLMTLNKNYKAVIENDIVVSWSVN